MDREQLIKELTETIAESIQIKIDKAHEEEVPLKEKIAELLKNMDREERMAQEFVDRYSKTSYTVQRIEGEGYLRGIKYSIYLLKEYLLDK